MAWWPFNRKESAVGRLIYALSMGRPVWTPRNYTRLAEESYVKNAVAYRCVRLTAEAFASLSWLVRQGQTDHDEHPVLDLLQSPNPMEGGVEFLERLLSFYQLAGNVYLEAVILDGEIREWWILRPDRMKIELDNRGYPATYIYTVGQQETRFQMRVSRTVQQPIMHLKSFHPTNDTYGMSSVEAGAFAIDVHNSAGAYNKSFLDNQARPSGALRYTGGKDGKGTLADEQFARLKKDLDEQYTGQQNAGRPFLLDGGLEWVEMGTTPRDMEFVEGKREAAREVSLAFGVPPMLLGIPGDNTYSNYQEANRAFYRQTVMPLASRFAMALSTFLRPTFGSDLEVDYDQDQIPALATERESVWDKVKSADWLTVDEKREATGYVPYKPAENPGSVLLVPSTSVPIEDMEITEEEPPPPELNEEEDT